MNQIKSISEKLELLNPQAQLDRGYSIATDKHGDVIFSIDQVSIDDVVQLRIANGKLETKVLEKERNNG